MLLSQRLKELRAAKGLSQAALADILGRTQQAIGKWEVGRSEPDGATLLKLAAYFNVTTDYLLGLSDHPHGEPFAGQSGKNFLDFADQPHAPAGQSGKQSLGSAEGAVSIDVATGIVITGHKTIQAEPLTPEEEAMIRAYREAPNHIRKIVDTALRSEVADEEEKQA